jgi:hypothetical protein
MHIGHKLLKNRQYVSMVCEMVKLLSKLGLPFRGHNERQCSSSKGNFQEICDCLSKYVDSFSEMRQNYFNCSSPEFQNDIINICATTVRNEIVEAVTRVGFYTIIADEASSSRSEQLSICERYADGLSVKERFVTFVDCSSFRNAEGIAKSITETLQDLKLNNLPIVGQSYDGAAVMSGHVSGVQQRIALNNPSAKYFHCLAHKLNLVLVNACRVNRMAVRFFNTIEQLYCFFAKPGRHDVYVKVQNVLGLKPRETGQLSDTRWACRWKSVEAIMTNYAAVIKSLTELSDPAIGLCSAEAAGLSQQILHLLESEMELFSSTDHSINLDVIQNELTEAAYPQYYRLVQLALTLPVGTASVERGFSAMRRIRNWMRLTMGQERFSSLALLNIESDLTAALDPEQLVQMYASTGNRRLQLY